MLLARTPYAQCRPLPLSCEHSRTKGTRPAYTHRGPPIPTYTHRGPPIPTAAHRGNTCMTCPLSRCRVPTARLAMRCARRPAVSIASSSCRVSARARARAGSPFPCPSTAPLRHRAQYGIHGHSSVIITPEPARTQPTCQHGSPAACPSITSTARVHRRRLCPATRHFGAACVCMRRHVHCCTHRAWRLLPIPLSPGPWRSQRLGRRRLHLYGLKVWMLVLQSRSDWFPAHWTQC